jgi:hemoglobin/transferrin/lactoferrin receptor protein
MAYYATSFVPLVRSSAHTMRTLPWLLTGLWSTLACMPAAAQSTPTLKETIVSGSRSEQSQDDVPATAEVINSQKLEAGQIGDIRDLVRDIPNVSVQRAPARFSLAGASTGRSGNSGFNIRGLDGNRVLILVDGLRTPRSYAFGAAAFGRDTVDVTQLKRVEIIKGPASALYGSDGLAGMVNFITLAPEDYLSSNKNIGGRVSLGYSGDDKGLNASATVAGKPSDTVQWLLSAHAGRAKALSNEGTNDASNVDRTTPNPQKDRNISILGKLVVRPSAAQKHTLALEMVDKSSDYALLSARAKQPLVATSALNVDALTQSQRQRISWEARYKVNAAVADQLQTTVSLQNTASREYASEDRNTAADRVRDVTYDEKTLQLGIQADKLLRIGADSVQKITYGLDYVGTKVNNLNTGITPAAGETFPLKRFPDTNETSVALYAQNEIVIGAFSLIPALRWDRFSIDASQAGFSPPSATPAASVSGSAISPKLGALYNATPQWTIFGNYASGFKAPNAGQINAFFENLTSFYKTIPNPDLKPEKSRNIELGVRGRLNALTLDASVFKSRYKDLIEESSNVGGAGVVGNPTIFQSVNIGDASISGFELKANYQWGSFAGGKLSTPFFYGQTKGTDNTNNLPINSIDPAKLGIGLGYESAVWDLRLDATRYSGKSDSDINSPALIAAPALQFATPAATVFNISGQWRIRKDLRMNLAVMNLTDKKYWGWNNVRGVSSTSTVTDAFTQPGRSLNVSLVAYF